MIGQTRSHHHHLQSHCPQALPLGEVCPTPLRQNENTQPYLDYFPLLDKHAAHLDSDPPTTVWDLSITPPVAHIPVPLSGCPLTLLQLISGPGIPVAPQRSNTALPKGDLMLATPGRSCGLWHFLTSSWLKATPARLWGLAHLSLASMKARFGAQPSRKWTNS